MAAGNTYTPIASTTLGSNGTITFTSIPSTYTDLRLIINGGVTNYGWDFLVRVNSDSGTNYSRTTLYGDGSGTTSGRALNATKMSAGLGQNNNQLTGIAIFDFMDYSNTTTYKPCLVRFGQYDGLSGTAGVINLWRSTAAINSIYIYCGASNDGQTNLYAGTTATLYGIAAA